MPEATPSFTPKRRWIISLNVLLASVALVLLLGMANYLAIRHYKRFELSAHSTTKLSPLTRQILRALTNEVTVVEFFDRNDELFSSVDSLLKTYEYYCPRLHLQTVDYIRNASAAQAVQARYGLTGPKDEDLVIFDCNGRTKLVRSQELSDYDTASWLSGKTKQIHRLDFKGEQRFTSAILSVTEKQRPKAYFLEGHGEDDPKSDDSLLGYSKFSRVLQEKNIAVETLRLHGTNGIPPDCDVLIVAGPRYPLLPPEAKTIERYLDQGGRLFLLMSFMSLTNDTGWEKLMSHWGLRLGHDVVRDYKNTVTKDDIILSHFTPHPILNPIFNARLYMLRPRSVRQAADSSQNTDTLQVKELVSTGPAGFTQNYPREGNPNPGPGLHGKIPVVAAVEKGNIQGVSADRGATRIVVAGDSIFLANETLPKAANREFASLAVNWLLDRNLLLGEIGPRPVHEYQVILSTPQLRTVRWILLAILPGGVLLLGAVVWLWQRN